jgi:hypothetical protein
MTAIKPLTKRELRVARKAAKRLRELADMLDRGEARIDLDVEPVAAIAEDEIVPAFVAWSMTAQSKGLR